MRILVHGASWVGDAVMTIPALRELRRVFHEASITLYSRKWAQGVFQDCDFVDRIVVSEPADGFWQESSLLRSLKFDAAVLFPNSFRTALIAKFARIPVRVGYKNEGRGFMLSDPVAKPSESSEIHQLMSYFALVRELETKLRGTSSISEENPDTRLEVSDARKSKAKQRLLELGADPSRPTIGFGVGSQNSNAKRWSPASYAELIDLFNTPAINAVLLGSELETKDSRTVCAVSTTGPIDLVGKTGLAEAVAIASVCDLFVSNDMGLTHAASAAGTKTLTIFGPTNPLTTRPWNGEIIRREDVRCSPCMLRDCPIDHRCMNWITPSDVYEIAIGLLRS